MQFLQSPAASSLLGPIGLSPLCNTLNLRPLTVRDQAALTPIQNYSFICFNHFILRQQTERQKILNQMVGGIP